MEGLLELVIELRLELQYDFLIKKEGFGSLMSRRGGGS